MRATRLPLFLLLTAFVAVACSDDEVTGPDTDSDPGITVADLVGSWTASSFTYTNNADDSETFDLIANGGEFRVTVLSDGRARMWATAGEFEDEWDALLAVNGDVLTATPAEATRETSSHTITLEGGVLTLTDTDSSFDFTLMDGEGVSATEVIVLQKQ